MTHRLYKDDYMKNVLYLKSFSGIFITCLSAYVEPKTGDNATLDHGGLALMWFNVNPACSSCSQPITLQREEVTFCCAEVAPRGVRRPLKKKIFFLKDQ